MILLVNANERELGMQRFMLTVRGFRVLTAQDATDALILHARGDVDLVLGFDAVPGLGWGLLAEGMKQAQPDVPILLIGLRDVDAANVAWCPTQMATCELLERVRLLIRRKRGPRKVAPVLVPAVAGD
jgi:two-component system, OmpR family, response regulator CpxR